MKPHSTPYHYCNVKTMGLALCTGLSTTLMVALVSGLLALAKPARAQDRADIDRTQIIGNRELPKVLYILPWKKPVPGNLAGRPLVSVVDEVLAPLDRDVFQRQVRYELQTRDKPASTALAVAPTPAPKITP
jgi:hypothetical protein